MNAAIPADRYALGTARGSAATLERIAYIGLCGFLFFLPWEEAPQLNGFALSRWSGVATLAIAVLWIAVKNQRRSLSAAHYLMAGFVGLSAMSLCWTADVESTLTRIGTYSQLLVSVWLIWELATFENRVLGLMQAYLAGIFMASMLTIYNFASGATAAQLEAAPGVERWDEGRYTILGINENDLGLMLAMAMPLMIYMVVRVKNNWMRTFLWIQLIAAIAAIFLTGSRGALISAAIASTMLPLSFRFLPQAQKMAAVLACVCAAACAIFLVPAEIWGRLLSFSTELTQGTLTNRTLIWSAGLAAFRDHPFLGVGSGAYAATVLKVLNVPYVAHNTFLSVLVELGVVGALVLLGMIASLYYVAFRMPTLERRLWVTVLVTWTVGVMALAWEYRKPTWMMFGLLLAHAYSRKINTIRFAKHYAESDS
jgi:O-antigen ligase